MVHRYAQAERDGSLVECGCCMSDNIFENCVQCSDGHLFCQGCLNHYCEQTVFGDGHSRIKCMSTTEECSGSFSEAFLEKALAPKVSLHKYLSWGNPIEWCIRKPWTFSTILHTITSTAHDQYTDILIY